MINLICLSIFYELTTMMNYYHYIYYYKNDMQVIAVGWDFCENAVSVLRKSVEGHDLQTTEESRNATNQKTLLNTKLSSRCGTIQASKALFKTYTVDNLSFTSWSCWYLHRNFQTGPFRNLQSLHLFSQQSADLLLWAESTDRLQTFACQRHYLN